MGFAGVIAVVVQRAVCYEQSAVDVDVARIDDSVLVADKEAGLHWPGWLGNCVCCCCFCCCCCCKCSFCCCSNSHLSNSSSYISATLRRPLPTILPGCFVDLAVVAPVEEFACR